MVDDDGYKYYTSLKDLIYRNKRPTKIYPGNIYSIDNIKNYIHLNDMSCELLTSEFVDSETKWIGVVNAEIFLKCRGQNFIKDITHVRNVCLNVNF